MCDVILTMAALCLVAVIAIFVSALMSLDEQALADFHYCYGCQCGWCTAVPDSEECRAHQKRRDADADRKDT